MQPNIKTWRLKPVTFDAWMNFAVHVKHGNLMQSWAYGEAKRVEGWLPERFILLDGSGNYCGLLQVLVKTFCRALKVARINRGPLFFASSYNEKTDGCNFTKIWEAINGHALRSGWHIILAAPETNTLEASVTNIMAKAGFFKKISSTPWASIRLSLNQDVEQLLEQLDGKWRNLLRKGLKLQHAVLEVNTSNEINTILGHYERFQVEKGFDGVPQRIIKSLVGTCNLDQTAMVYQTLCDETMEVSGFVIITYHFDTAMYLAGWSSPKGRKQQANSLLLWQAINDAKSKGIKWFDMGGLTKNTPVGVAHFKKGIGGDYYSNTGDFWSAPIFSWFLSLLAR
jgi:lipid II:glycine glycyltransferase (peptidoglycan interpeptide bridge formation enzyme)